MATQGLFGDDDSSDDDDDDDDDGKDAIAKQQQPEKPPPKETTTDNNNNNINNKPKNATLEEDNDDDDDDDDDDGKNEKDKEPVKEKPKRPTLHDSDSDDDDDEDEFDDKGAVVGVAATVTSNKNKAPAPAAAAEASALSDDEEHDDGERRHEDDSPNKHQQQRLPEVDHRPLTLPRVNRIPETNISMHITKLPNLMGIKSTPFDPDDYSPTIEEEDYGPSAVHNLMRWRYKRGDTGHILRDDKDKLIRESNSRLVEWEDGTWTLHIGTESFEVVSKNMATPDGFMALNGYLYLSQPASVTGENKDGGGKPAGTVLECFGGIHSRLAAQPSSLQSDAHKALTVAVRQRTIKKARIAEIATAEDPEKLKQERIRIKSDLEKAKAKKRTGGGGGGGRRARMSRSYLEDDDDGNYDTYDIGGAKRRMRGDDYDNYAEEEEEEQDLAADNTFNAKRPTKRARKEEPEDDDDIVVQDDDDDDDEDEDALQARAKPSSKKPAHRAFIDDEDSE